VSPDTEGDTKHRTSHQVEQHGEQAMSALLKRWHGSNSFGLLYRQRLRL
jgi:hypothetical protein